MPHITIDATALSFPLFIVPEIGGDFAHGSAAFDLAAGDYGFQQMSGIPADFRFQVTEAGTIDFDATFDHFLNGRGTDTLTVSGHPVVLDLTELSCSVLLLMGYAELAPTRHALSMVPAAHHWFISSPGVNADFDFSINLDGTITVDDDHAHLATADGSDLNVHGVRIVVDLTDAAFDLHTGLLPPTVEPIPRGSATELRLLPGRDMHWSSEQGPPPFDVSVDTAGLVDYDANLDPWLAGRGTTTLTGTPANPAAVQWATADQAVPLMLLPVRIETQSYRPGVDGPAAGDVDGVDDADTRLRLRVRIYPDDIGMDRAAGTPLLLPAAFEVHVLRSGHPPVVAHGLPVTLQRLGLAAAPAEDGGRGSDGDRIRGLADAAAGLHTGDGPAAWLGDYRQARTLGMAITVPIDDADPAAPVLIDQLLVLGIPNTTPPATQAADLNAALAAHRSARTGAAFLPAGTPTNNTEPQRSGWSRATQAGPATEPEHAPATTTAARQLADALGVEPDVLSTFAGADGEDITDASAMVAALWPVTWDTYLDRAVNPGRLDETGRNLLREHATAHLRGRGPLPGLRIGRQPYGILPATVLAEYEPSPDVPGALVGILRRLQPLWQAAAAAIPTVWSAPLDTVLPEILGQSPVSRGLRLRRLLNTGGMWASAHLGWDQAKARQVAAADVERLLGLPPRTLAEPPELGVDRTVTVPMVADSDCDNLRQLLADGTTCDDSVLQVLLSLAFERTREAVHADRGAVLGWGQHIRDGADLAIEAGRWNPGNDEQPVPESTLELSDLLIRSFTSVATAELTPPPEPEYFVDWMRNHAGDLDPHVAQPSLLGAMYPPFRPAAPNELYRMFGRAALHSAVTHGIARIADVTDTDTRRGLLAETLDCASHRLDAWVTSLADAQLTTLRKNARSGLSIGAYGYVENLRLTPRQPADGEQFAAPRDGVILAPGTSQAAAAAALRAARLTHSPTDSGEDALEIDLSSTRVRQARDLIAGMRAGQDLGAMLGYRFERWLAEQPALQRFLPALRTIAPKVVTSRTPPQPGHEPDPHLAATAVTQVVDGLRLHNLDPDALLTQLATVAAELDHYGPIPAPTPDELPTLRRLLARLGLLLDAVADLLLAESIHQLAQGNTAQAAAAMDAMSGDTLPPPPEVLTTQRHTIGMTHRVLIMQTPTTTLQAGDGWDTGTVAAAHPSLETWCRRALGPATRIVLDDGGHHVDRIGISAVDLVLAATTPAANRPVDQNLAGFQTWWARTQRTNPDLGAPLIGPRPQQLAAGTVTIGEIWLLAAAVHMTLGTARPLHPDDVRHPAAPHPDDARAPDLHDLQTRTMALAEALHTTAGQSVPADRGAKIALADHLATLGINADLDPAALADDDPPPEDTLSLAGTLTGHIRTGQTRAAARVSAALDAIDPGATTESWVDVLAMPEPDRTDQAALRAASADLDSWQNAMAQLTADALPSLVNFGPTAEPTPATPPCPPGATQTFLARMSAVRPKVKTYLQSLLARHTLTGRTTVTARQFTGPGQDSTPWALQPFPKGQPPTADIISLLVEEPPETDWAGPITGLVIDGWTETIPRARPARDTDAAPADPDAPGEDVATVGLALHANGPDSRAPHLILLAVPPKLGAAWTAEKVRRTVTDTIDLARTRMVTLERAPLGGFSTPALQLQHWSLQGERVIDPTLLQDADHEGFLPLTFLSVKGP